MNSPNFFSVTIRVKIIIVILRFEYYNEHMNLDFFFEETWAGYKELVVQGQRLAFLYGWEEVDQEYLGEVVEKYPNVFVLEDDGGGNNFLKIRLDAVSKLELSVLLDVVDNDPSEWFELVDLDTKILLNSSRQGQASDASESLGL